MRVFKWQKYKSTETPLGCCLECRKTGSLGKLFALSYDRIECALLLHLAIRLLCPYRSGAGRKQTSTETFAGANAHSCFIPNSRNLGTTQVSTQRRSQRTVLTEKEYQH